MHAALKKSKLRHVELERVREVFLFDRQSFLALASESLSGGGGGGRGVPPKSLIWEQQWRVMGVVMAGGRRQSPRPVGVKTCRENAAVVRLELRASPSGASACSRDNSTSAGIHLIHTGTYYLAEMPYLFQELTSQYLSVVNKSITYLRKSIAAGTQTTQFVWTNGLQWIACVPQYLRNALPVPSATFSAAKYVTSGILSPPLEQLILPCGTGISADGTNHFVKDNVHATTARHCRRDGEPAAQLQRQAVMVLIVTTVAPLPLPLSNSSDNS